MQIVDIPSHVREALQERGYSQTQMEALTPEGMFHEFCLWHGLINWSSVLWKTVTQLQEVAR